MRNLFILLGCIGLFAAGVGTGWALPVAGQQTAYLSYIGRHGEGFEVLMALAELTNAASQYSAAIDYLLRAAQQIDNQLRQR